MPTPLFRLDLTRHLDPVLQLVRARPDRVQLVAWAVRYLAENTDGLDLIIVERPGTLRPVEVLGAAWLDAAGSALVIWPAVVAGRFPLERLGPVHQGGPTEIRLKQRTPGPGLIQEHQPQRCSCSRSCPP